MHLIVLPRFHNLTYLFCRFSNFFVRQGIGQLDAPMNRFILDATSHCLFLSFILASVIFIERDSVSKDAMNVIQPVVALFAFAHFIHDLHELARLISKKAIVLRARLFFSLTMDFVFLAAIVLKVSYKACLLYNNVPSVNLITISVPKYRFMGVSSCPSTPISSD